MGTYQAGSIRGTSNRPECDLQDNGNVSRCYRKDRPRVATPNEDWYMWQLLPKETDGAQHQICRVSSL
ncbi:hypothetical protein TNCV_2210131 [Trichonephila clavipes]|nr:hypothetical protein TNCV_2210131 [Trichonephila clavipes]